MKKSFDEDLTGSALAIALGVPFFYGFVKVIQAILLALS